MSIIGDAPRIPPATAQNVESGSEEEGEVLREQDALVEDDLAPGDLPVSIDLAEQILALADEDVGLRLHPVPVDEEAALDGDLRRRWRSEERSVGKEWRCGWESAECK